MDGLGLVADGVEVLDEVVGEDGAHGGDGADERDQDADEQAAENRGGGWVDFVLVAEELLEYVGHGAEDRVGEGKCDYVAHQHIF